MSFRKEPPHIHGTPDQIGLVLINLGTPDAPTTGALRRYLKEFLSDPRVVEIPRALWWLILRCIILPLRPARSAAKYKMIWTAEGSPLKFHTEKQALLLRGYLGERGHQLQVAYAMRYAEPAVATVMARLQAEGCQRILIVPAYPQYSGATTGSSFDAVFRHYATVRNVPELRLVKHYHDHPAYIGALRKSVQAHWQQNGKGEKLVMSFHGMPRRTLLLGDPYYCECQKTGRLLAQALGLAEDQYLVTFQSRFGKAEWLQPYTSTTVQTLAKQGVRRVDVICPGFVADCLETLEEIGMEVKRDFLQAGGSEFHYIAALNEMPEWISALADIAEEHLNGWPTVPMPVVGSRTAEQAASRAAALRLGAEQ
ncbi:MAG TPA: ferrochelatase [Burkholderiaceae bacterium]|nr:ferrochelatase [Burkholderiaceae bacterium]